MYLLHGLLAFAALPVALARFTPSIPIATALPPATSEAGFIQARAGVTTATDEPMPTSTTDPWECVLANVTKYFEVVTPTGVFSEALMSYGLVLVKPCLATATGLDGLDCTVTKSEDWCAFSTTAPSAIATSYASYASSAADFWRSNSASISSVSSSCPNWWGRPDAVQHVWLSQYITHAGCYLAAHPSTSTNSLSSARPGLSSVTLPSSQGSSTANPALPGASAAANSDTTTSGAASLGFHFLRYVFRALAW